MKSCGTITTVIVKDRKVTIHILSNYIFKVPFFCPEKSTHHILMGSIFDIDKLSFITVVIIYAGRIPRIPFSYITTI